MNSYLISVSNKFFYLFFSDRGSVRKDLIRINIKLKHFVKVQQLQVTKVNYVLWDDNFYIKPYVILAFYYLISDDNLRIWRDNRFSFIWHVKRFYTFMWWSFNIIWRDDSLVLYDMLCNFTIHVLIVLHISATPQFLMRYKGSPSAKRSWCRKLVVSKNIRNLTL